MHKKTIATFAMLVSLPALSVAKGSLLSAQAEQWLSRVQTPTAEVSRELTTFPGLPSEYVQKAPGYVSSRVARGLELVMNGLSSGRCEPGMEVEFMKQVSNDGANSRPVRDFEADVIHIRVLGCLEGVTPAQVASAYESAEFKLKSADTVVSSRKRGKRVCQVTKVAILGESEYCYDEESFSDEKVHLIHSFNDWNREGVEAPVYFREMLAMTMETKVNGNSGTAFYTDVYVRGKKLPGLFKGFANSSLASSQNKSLEVLYAIAQKQPSK